MLATNMILGSHPLLEQLKHLSILYVEDDEVTRTLIKTALETIVQQVYVAKNGEEGLELYKKFSPDIVLTDRYMPKMDGVEMAQKIKELKPTQAIGMFTGSLKSVMLNDGSSEPIDVYLNKPLNRKQFYKALKNLIALL